MDTGTDVPDGFPQVPVLVVIPVLDSFLERPEKEASSRLRERVLREAWEGLAVQSAADRGYSIRVSLVGLHEFASRSRSAAAAGEGLVFAGSLEEENSLELAEKLCDLAGPWRGAVDTKQTEKECRTMGPGRRDLEAAPFPFVLVRPPRGERLTWWCLTHHGF